MQRITTVSICKQKTYRNPLKNPLKSKRKEEKNYIGLHNSERSVVKKKKNKNKNVHIPL